MVDGDNTKSVIDINSPVVRAWLTTKYGQEALGAAAASQSSSSPSSTTVYVGMYRPPGERYGALSELEYLEYTGYKLGEDDEQVKREALEAFGVSDKDIKLTKQEERELIESYLDYRYKSIFGERSLAQAPSIQTLQRDITLIAEKGMLRSTFEKHDLKISEETLSRYIEKKRELPEIDFESYTFPQFAYEETIASRKPHEQFGIGLFTQQGLGFYEIGKTITKPFGIDIRNEYADLLTVAQSYKPLIPYESHPLLGVAHGFAPYQQTKDDFYNVGVTTGIFLDIITLRAAIKGTWSAIKQSVSELPRISLKKPEPLPKMPIHTQQARVHLHVPSTPPSSVMKTTTTTSTPSSIITKPPPTMPQLAPALRTGEEIKKPPIDLPTPDTAAAKPRPGTNGNGNGKGIITTADFRPTFNLDRDLDIISKPVFKLTNGNGGKGPSLIRPIDDSSSVFKFTNGNGRKGVGKNGHMKEIKPIDQDMIKHDLDLISEFKQKPRESKREPLSSTTTPPFGGQTITTSSGLQLIVKQDVKTIAKVKPKPPVLRPITTQQQKYYRNGKHVMTRQKTTTTTVISQQQSSLTRLRTRTRSRSYQSIALALRPKLIHAITRLTKVQQLKQQQRIPALASLQLQRPIAARPTFSRPIITATPTTARPGPHPTPTVRIPKPIPYPYPYPYPYPRPFPTPTTLITRIPKPYPKPLPTPLTTTIPIPTPIQLPLPQPRKPPLQQQLQIKRLRPPHTKEVTEIYTYKISYDIPRFAFKFNFPYRRIRL